MSCVRSEHASGSTRQIKRALKRADRTEFSVRGHGSIKGVIEESIQSCSYVIVEGYGSYVIDCLGLMQNIMVVSLEKGSLLSLFLIGHLFC